MRPLAVTSLTRAPSSPDLPTMVEAGFPGFDATAWFGLLAPAGTPAPIIAKLHREAVRILALPDVRKRFDELDASHATAGHLVCSIELSALNIGTNDNPSADV